MGGKNNPNTRRAWLQANREQVRQYSRSNDAANREHRRQYARAHYAKHREQMRQDRREWYRKNRAAKIKADRRHHLLSTYGLTLAEYDALLVAQGGGCAICGQPPGCMRLDVDHDHVTNINRGLLCGSCNRALGLAKDSPERLEKMAAYLRRGGDQW